MGNIAYLKNTPNEDTHLYKPLNIIHLFTGLEWNSSFLIVYVDLLI